MCCNSKIILVSVLRLFPRIMPAKLVTYNSQNDAGTLGSGLMLIYVIRFLASDFNAS